MGLRQCSDGSHAHYCKLRGPHTLLRGWRVCVGLPRRAYMPSRVKWLLRRLHCDCSGRTRSRAAARVNMFLSHAIIQNHFSIAAVT